MSPENMRYVWNPEHFDPLDYLPSRLRRHADAARALVHLIEHRRLDRRYKAHDGVALKASYLRNVVGVEHCEAIRDCLAAAGVISINRSYTPGQKSFEFKIGPLFEASPFRRFQIADKFLVRRMDKHLARTRPDTGDPIQLHLFNWLTKLTIEVERAKGYVSAFGAGAEWVRQKSLTIDMLAERDFWFTRDRFGRIHTNFTNLWSGLRQFLSVGGEPLVELDIANSQPLFFGFLVLAKWQLAQGSGCHHTASTVNGSTSQVSHHSSNNVINISPPPIPSLYDAGIADDNSRRHLPPDLDKYLRLVERGTFYEHLIGTSRRPAEDRDEFKESFFRHVFYAKTQYPNALANVFRQEFPTAHRVLTEVKENEPRDAPRKMQQLEADFVIGTCCRKLLTAHPQVPVRTLHDGIWTTPKHIDLVRQTVGAEFAELGVRPLLRCRTADGAALAPGVSVQT